MKIRDLLTKLAYPDGVVRVEKQLTQDEIDAMRKDFEAQYRGPEKATEVVEIPEKRRPGRPRKQK